MRLSLPFRLVATVFLSFLSLAASAQAGGSLTRDEFLDAIGDENLRRLIVQRFELAEEGRALRAGRHLPNAGERLIPFEILARPNGAEGDEIVLRLDSVRSPQVAVLPCAESAHYGPNCD